MSNEITKIEEVIQEISKVDDDLRADYDRIKNEQSQLLQKVEKIKPNEIWKSIPVVKWILYDKKIEKINTLNTQANQLDIEKQEN